MANASDIDALPEPEDSARPVDPAHPEAAVPILRRRSVRVGLAIGVALLMVLPALVAIVTLAGRSWLPVDDFGVTDLRVRDVWTSNTPLTGLYSRPGWNHPGPLMFWLMALISGPTGEAAWATRISGAVIQAGALGWLAWVTWRRGLRVLLAAATVTALAYVAFEPVLFTQPWNPNIPVTSFILLLYLTALAAEGNFRQLIAVSIVGNVIMQIHISYASLVVACLAWVIVCTTWDAWRDRRAPRAWRSTIAISAGVWIVAWALPIVDVATNWPGNLGKIAAYFVQRGHPSVGIDAATGIMADEFRWLPNWLGATTRLDPFDPYTAPASRLLLLVPMVLLVVGFLCARRTRSKLDGRMVGLAAVMLVAGTMAISNADEARGYTFQWRVVIAVFLVVTCLWSIGGALRSSLPVAVRYLSLVVVLGVVAWGSIDMAVAVGTRPEYEGLEQRGPVLGKVMDQLRAEGLPDGSVLIEVAGSDLHVYDGLINALDRDGVDVRVLPLRARMFGEHRVSRRGETDEVWTVTEHGSYLPQLLATPGARVVARIDPLTPAEEVAITRLQQQLLQELRGAGRIGLRDVLDSPHVALVLSAVPGVDQAAAAQLSMLNARAERSGLCRCAVVSLPAAAGAEAIGR